MGTVIGRINQVLRGWTNYFRHAVCHFVEWWLIRCLRKRRRWRWSQLSAQVHHGQRAVAADRVRQDRAVRPRRRWRVPRYSHRAALPRTLSANEPCLTEPAVETRCAEKRTPGSARGPGKRTGNNADIASRADSTSLTAHPV